MSKPPVVFSGGSNPALAHAICKELGITPGRVFLHQFPSGESYCQYHENLRGEDVFIVQSVSHPANDNLMELLVMIDAASRASADRITAVIPYFGYIRQDRKDKPRVPISAKLVMNLLESSGVDRILTLDLHVPQAQGMTNLPFDHLNSDGLFVKHIQSSLSKDELSKIIIISPDVGGVKRAELYADHLSCECGFIVKKRENDTTVTANALVGNVRDKICIVVDDVAESCGTLVKARNILHSFGARDVKFYVSHGCVTETGIDRLKQHITGLITTNSVARPCSEHVVTKETWDSIDASPLFARAIDAIHSNKSISQILRVEKIL